MITFTRAMEPSVGAPVTSRQARSLGLAVNDRARAVGDVAWRCGFYIYNSARQIRNPDGWLWPSMGEYWEHYQHAEPSRGELWPEELPGEPQGANVASTIAGFVHGIGATDAEADRLFKDDGAGANLLRAANVADTPAMKWYRGQRQRGVYDPVTGGQNVPAFEAAQSYAAVDQLSTEVWLPAVSGGAQVIELNGQGTQVHGRSYGGYLPQPEWLGDCGDDDQTPSFQYLFTALRPGVPTNGTNPCTGTAAMVFTGSCPDWTPGYAATHVRGILRTTHAYFVVQWNGTVTMLPAKDYIEGPYCSGGYLDKAHGDHLSRLVLNSFVKDFRGSDADRAAPTYDVETVGFDFDRFDRAQYFLSPNLGHVEGEYLVGDYPLFSFASAAAAGTLATYAGGGTSHAYRSGFVLGGCLLVGTLLAGPVTVELVGTGGAVLREVVLEPDVNGDAQVATWFEDAPSPQPLSVRLKSALAFTGGGGSIEVECTEQMAYKPEVHDRYLFLRMAATTGTELASMDGVGTDYHQPRELSDGYFAGGCIVSRTPADIVNAVATLNDNPGFDAYRRFTRDKFRVMRRAQVVGYAVESGKSVLWFKRYSTLDDDFDLFEGIAPAADAVPSGSLAEGIEYVVRTAAIVYAGTSYAVGQRFTATAVAEFTGAGAVYVYDGIRHVAPLASSATPYARPSTTNEWLMNVETQMYHWASDNLWKPDAMADFFTYCQRCHVLAPRIAGSQNLDLRRHFNYGMSLSLSPEAPPGYHYAGTANTFTGWPPEDRARFYKSCRIYEPWPEVESAIVEFVGAEEFVKLTFTARFHHCESDEGGFSGDLARDMATWSTAQMNGETFRSFENGIRQYLYHQYAGGGGGTYNPARKIGDMGAEAVPDSGNPYGSIYPHFFFLKLVPIPREDGNDEIDPTDAPIVMDLAQHVELYARAMCEGFVDGVTSTQYGCRAMVTMAYDYRWENLMFDIGAGRWLGTLPGDVRPDEQSGFSALPSTVLYAEVFSQLARAVNALDKLRILLPLQLLYRTNAYTGTMAVTPFFDTGDKAVWTGSPPAGDVEDPLGWGEWVPWTGGVGATSIATLHLGGDGWYVQTVRNVLEFKFELLDANAIHALPTPLRDMLTDQVGIASDYETQTGRSTAHGVSVESEAQDCPENSGMNRFFLGGTGYRFEASTVDTTECRVFTHGLLDPGAPPSSAFYSGVSLCGNASFFSIGVIPASQLGRFISVPLVDP